MVRPKKHLGQHFLTDPAIAGRIVGALSARNASVVLEIGPGKGILTKPLMERNFENLKLVEIDSESVEYLLLNWPELKEGLVRADFLKLDLTEIGEKIAIIGNFPYNISSQIFFHILEDKDRVPEVVCMIQKEVAERIVSPPGSRDYGILSVLLQTWYDIELLFQVSPGSFFPPPKVKSAVIRLTRNNRKKLACSDEFYRKLVKTAFNQRRKMLRNSISSFLSPEESGRELFMKRPEQLSADDFISLATELESANISRNL